MNNNIFDKVVKDIESKKFSERDTISDLQVYKTENVTYSLPINSTPKLRQYFHSAVLAYTQDKDFKQIIAEQTNIEDFFDERYWDKHLLLSFLLITEVDFQHNVVCDLAKCIEASEKSSTVGENIFFCTLFRLRDSFKSIFVLRNHGLYIEMYPLMRLIYEQLCWACFSIDQTDYEKLKQTPPTRTVRYLKEKIRNSYGKLYKNLSDMAHMLPASIEPYWDIKDNGSGISIHGRSEEKANKELPNVLDLFCIYLEVVQYGLSHFSSRISDDDYEYYKFLIDCSFYAIDIYNTCYQTDNWDIVVEEKFERI